MVLRWYAKWRYTRSSLACEVIRFMATFGVQMWAIYLIISGKVEIPMIHTPSPLRMVLV